MPKKSKKTARKTLNLKTFQEILERTTNSLEYRVVGRIKTELDKKPDRTELDKKPDKEEVQRIVNSEMNKAAEVMRFNFEERDERLKDHESRLQKLETAA